MLISIPRPTGQRMHRSIRAFPRTILNRDDLFVVQQEHRGFTQMKYKRNRTETSAM